MKLHRVAEIARRFTPKRLFGGIRAIGTAALTPFFFGYKSGHLRSSLLGKPVNKEGAPIPWYTYAAIDFLTDKDFKDKKILEWGSGHSTLWWAKRSGQVLSFESDRAWLEYIKKTAPDNVALHLLPDNLEGIEAYLDLERPEFDVIIIDGLDRFQCALKSWRLLARHGAIILDDSDGFWGEEGKYPIMDLFREKGYQRVDFYGYAPGGVQPHCTSIFFKPDCFLTSGAGYPRRISGHAADK